MPGLIENYGLEFLGKLCVQSRPFPLPLGERIYFVEKHGQNRAFPVLLTST